MGAPEVKAASACPIFYTNHMQVSMTYFDLAMLVCTKRMDESIEPFCELHMSPQHAKVLVAVLSEHLKAYEAKIGTIQAPKPESTK